jgi:hypothetical protein
MNKNTKGAIVVGVVLAIGYGYYYLKISKYSYARTISKVTKRVPSYYLKDWDFAYIKAWALAIRNDKPTFEYNGKTFSIGTGKMI